VLPQSFSKVSGLIGLFPSGEQQITLPTTVLADTAEHALEWPDEHKVVVYQPSQLLRERAYYDEVSVGHMAGFVITADNDDASVVDVDAAPC
jgi:hypothetical protein